MFYRNTHLAKEERRIAMITTITLNPAIDKTYMAQTIVPGQVNRTRSVMSFPGGKGINVARILKQYGFKTCAMGFLGGYAGAFIKDSLEKLGIACRFTEIAGETRSNMNVLMDDGRVTEILEPGPCVTDAEWMEFRNLYEKIVSESTYVVLSGSIAKGLTENAYGELIRIAKKQNVPVLLDTSGEALRQGLKEKPFLCKPNVKELSYLVGRELETMEDILCEARKLQQSGIELVLVSMGEEGLLAVEKEGYHLAKVAGVTPVNTVGCGDSVIASFAMSLESGDSIETAIKRSTAISAANATSMQSGQIPMDTAELFFKKVQYKKIEF